MSSEKSWLDLSDRPVERSIILDFLEDPRDIGSQPKNKFRDLTTVSVFCSQPKNELIGFDHIPEKSFYLNPEGISDPGIPIRKLERPITRPQTNYVELQQSYMEFFLNKVKHDVEKARLLDSDIEEIKNEAYEDTAIVMKKIYDAGVSSPEVDWNEDGSINLSWLLKTGGTSTISVYGDNHVIYNTYLGPDNYVRSVCKIRDRLLLPKLIGILSNITD